MPLIAYPECGKIINTHGCRGCVKIEPWCDSPAVLAALPAVYLKTGAGMKRLEVRHASVFRQFVFAELAGVDSMEAAEKLRGSVLYAKREELGFAPGVLLVAELVGMPVFDARTGAELGKMKDMIHPGATDIYVIDTGKGEALVPAVPEFVQGIDAEKGVFLTPIEGMFDDAL